MKKDIKDADFVNVDVSSNNNLESSNIKTTNVNILLNRVKLDKKKNFKKKNNYFSYFDICRKCISRLFYYLIINLLKKSLLKQ